MPVTNGSRYDFIIVGGGTAGNVVAGRLADNPSVKILVEAGVGNPEEVPDITTPAKAMDLRGSKYDWAYKTTIVKREDYERIEKPNTRGKTLGGSSSLNYFTWVPGCKPTFDRWAEFGGKEWTWDPLVPYLRKSATYHDDHGLYDKSLNKIGAGGPLPISHSELLDGMEGFREALTKAWKSTGQPFTENIYDGEMNGLTHCVDTIYHGRRSGSFLFVKNKPNITILPESLSKKLLFDEEGKKAMGVTILAGPEGHEISVYADREVIVSQGVFESPKLLMLSGIGPAKELTQHGIPLVVDSPHVGQNLLDHPGVPFVLKVKDGFGMDDHLLRTGPLNTAAVDQYKKDGTGPVGSGLLEMVGFPRIDKYLERDLDYVKAKKANGGLDPFSPEGQPHFELDFVCMFGSAFQWHYPVPKKGCYTSVVVDLVRPVSDPGEVKLRSADPRQQPDINLNFFASDLDILAMREGIRFSYDVLTKGEAFRDLVLDEYPWDMPLDDDAAMKHAVLDRCQTAFHPCGTNRLSKNIGQGVVDPELRVHGVSRLRVIDASVIPVIPDCRIQNSVYMIGEKGADLIKSAHKDLY
ncbi:glucose-methanol-choline oxidoreductase [Grosmannia clavigera kw1407]|uniref:Glucose-methanol-choline oxidoreductase n=1 Tax=Grosmannia clavigera (strain kw1407 / UAMH 11150) TaxID=655863 RepID=F0XL65_GROCL|nr:glucose-methanol-choline oxidoreductase [Grosmannia clavigera kw1407]EFX01567.1 glucose-methanol-choline oxidoreductase [Grosmannia clavigera kw1407]